MQCLYLFNKRNMNQRKIDLWKKQLKDILRYIAMSCNKLAVFGMCTNLPNEEFTSSEFSIYFLSVLWQIIRTTCFINSHFAVSFCNILLLYGFRHCWICTFFLFLPPVASNIFILGFHQLTLIFLFLFSF